MEREKGAVVRIRHGEQHNLTEAARLEGGEREREGVRGEDTQPPRAVYGASALARALASQRC